METEDPVKLLLRSGVFLLCIWYADDIVNLALSIRRHALQLDRGQRLPAVQFGNFNSTLLVIIGVIANGSVALIALILLIILAWNYLKLLLEAAERYITLGILVFTAPVAFALGASRSTSNIFKNLVPGVCQPAVTARYERLVPQAVYEHGGGVSANPLAL